MEEPEDFGLLPATMSRLLRVCAEHESPRQEHMGLITMATENENLESEGSPSGSDQLDKYGNKVTNMQKFDPDGEILSPGFALFNSHTNDAYDKAKNDMIRILGQDTWDEHIEPLEDGIMAIFDGDPVHETYWFVMRVTMYVNENMSFEMDDEIGTYCPAWHKETMEAFDEDN